MMLATDDFNEDFTHVMAGYALWIRGLKMPDKLVGDAYKPPYKT
jgi:hypothetical protein